MEIELTEPLNILFTVASFVVGATIGSFLNVCVHRLPRGLSVIKPRSRCPKCEKPIAAFDNIPILSWIILGAKCRNCGAPISWQYPAVEAITGVLFLGVYLKFGLTLATPIYMALAAALVLVTFVDLADWTIPNEVTFPGMPLGVACALLAMVYPESGLRVSSPLMAIAGLLLGGGILYALDIGSLIFLKKRGMGFGDVKLMAMLGAFFGPWGALLNIVIASFIGAAVGITLISIQRQREAEQAERAEVGEEAEPQNTVSPDDEDGGKIDPHYLPFGPCLALGGILVMFFGPEIIALYQGFIEAPTALT